jgi:hypothetical protein
MLIRLAHRKAFSCWLLAALLLQCLMPAIASVHKGDDARWIEVCVSSGVKWVQMPDGGDTQTSHLAAEHCALCAAAGAVPEFDVRDHLVDLPTFSVSPPPDRTALPSLSAFQRHSRAPPSFS